MNHYQIFLSVIREFVHFDSAQSFSNLDFNKLNKAIQLVWKEGLVINKWQGEPRPLQSILQKLKHKTLQYNGLPHYIKPQELIFEEAFFTLEVEIPSDESYRQHYSTFVNELNKVTSSETAYVIAQKYGTSVGFTEGVCDVSLFDFVKLVSAAYICLQQSDKVILVGGKLSGIQEFIYEIVPKTAAKSLKGRSAYIQLLLESAVFRLLKQLGLTDVNVLSSTGGKYFVLAPDTVEIRQKIEKLSDDFNNEMYAQHKTLISMLLTYVPIDDNVWYNLDNKLSTLKYQQFKSKLTDQFETFFEAQEKGGRTERDVVTNEEFNDEEIAELGQRLMKGSWSFIGYLEFEVNGTPIYSDDNKTAVKKSTYDMVRLGRRLIESKYWLISSDKNIRQKEKRYETAIKGVYHYFIKEEEKQHFNGYPLKQLNTTEGEMSWMLYGGNEFPTYQEDENKNRKGDIKDFSALALTEEKLQRLAILRMDVDGMGEKFKSGIENKNLVREATLSRTLEYFVKGYLNAIWRPYYDNSYILYSGGDDLFILGRWREVVDLADKIQTAFKIWAGYNPACTLSGGIAIVKPKFPVLHSARLAGEALDKSKIYKQGEKNALTLFDISMNWENEFSKVKDLKQDLLEFIGVDSADGERKPINKSLLSKINLYYTMKEYQETHNKNPRWVWTSLYDLTRFKENIKHSEAKAFVDDLKNNILLRGYITIAAVAARWMELEMRTEEN